MLQIATDTTKQLASSLIAVRQSFFLFAIRACCQGQFGVTCNFVSTELHSQGSGQISVETRPNIYCLSTSNTGLRLPAARSPRVPSPIPSQVEWWYCEKPGWPTPTKYRTRLSGEASWALGSPVGSQYWGIVSTQTPESTTSSTTAEL